MTKVVNENLDIHLGVTKENGGCNVDCSAHYEVSSEGIRQTKGVPVELTSEQQTTMENFALEVIDKVKEDEGANGIQEDSMGITIAAVDSRSEDKALADYICDGANDEVEIQAANDACAGVGGTVQLTAGTFYIQDDLIIEHCTLRGQGSGGPGNLVVTSLEVSDTKTVVVRRGGAAAPYSVGRLHNLTVYCPEGFTGTAVEIDGTYSPISNVMGLLRDVRIYNRTQSITGTATGTGLNIHAEASTGARYVGTSTFESVSIDGFEYGLKMTAENSATHNGWCNENTFLGLHIVLCKNPLILDNSGTNAGAVNGNKFMPLYIESYNGAVNGVSLIGAITTNYLLLWEWTPIAWYSGSQILLDASTSNNWIEGNYDPTGVSDSGTNNNIRKTTQLQRHKMVISFLRGQTTTVIGKNNPGVAYVDVDPYCWATIDFATIKRVIQARVFVTASGNEAGAGKGIEIWDNSAGAQLCEFTWDGASLKQGSGGAWSTTNMPTVISRMQARCKASSATEDLSIYSIEMEIDYE